MSPSVPNTSWPPTAETTFLGFSIDMVFAQSIFSLVDQRFFCQSWCFHTLTSECVYRSLLMRDVLSFVYKLQWFHLQLVHLTLLLSYFLLLLVWSYIIYIFKLISVNLSSFFTLFFHSVLIEIHFSDRYRVVGTAIIYFQICSFIICFKRESNCSKHINWWRFSELYFSITCIRKTTLQTVKLFCLYNYFVANNWFMSNMFSSVKCKIFILRVEILKFVTYVYLKSHHLCTKQ